MFKKILVPVDPAEPGFAQDSLAKAATFARDHGAKIHVLAVCPEVQSFVASQLPSGFQEKEVTETNSILKGIIADLDVPEGAVTTEVRIGTVDNVVIDTAADSGCDLIVMTSHKPGFSTYFVGSHAAHIVRHATCSVLVLRNGK